MSNNDNENFIKFAITGGYFFSPIGVAMFSYALHRDWDIASTGDRIFGFIIIIFCGIMYFIFRNHIKKNGWLWYK